MSLQKDAKKLLPFIQAASEGKKLTNNGVNIWGIEGAYCKCGHDYYHVAMGDLKIVRPPKFRAWASVEEMNEAVNPWFRFKNHDEIDLTMFPNSGYKEYVLFEGAKYTWKYNKIFSIREDNEISFNGKDFHFPGSILSAMMHSPDLKTWLPCGVEVKE